MKYMKRMHIVCFLFDDIWQGTVKHVWSSFHCVSKPQTVLRGTLRVRKAQSEKQSASRIRHIRILKISVGVRLKPCHISCHTWTHSSGYMGAEKSDVEKYVLAKTYFPYVLIWHPSSTLMFINFKYKPIWEANLVKGITFHEVTICFWCTYFVKRTL